MFNANALLYAQEIAPIRSQYDSVSSLFDFLGHCIATNRRLGAHAQRLAYVGSPITYLDFQKYFAPTVELFNDMSRNAPWRRPSSFGPSLHGTISLSPSELHLVNNVVESLRYASDATRLAVAEAVYRHTQASTLLGLVETAPLEKGLYSLFLSVVVAPFIFESPEIVGILSEDAVAILSDTGRVVLRPEFRGQRELQEQWQVAVIDIADAVITADNRAVASMVRGLLHTSPNQLRSAGVALQSIQWFFRDSSYHALPRQFYELDGSFNFVSLMQHLAALSPLRVHVDGATATVQSERVNVAIIINYLSGCELLSASDAPVVQQEYRSNPFAFMCAHASEVGSSIEMQNIEVKLARLDAIATDAELWLLFDEIRHQAATIGRREFTK